MPVADVRLPGADGITCEQVEACSRHDVILLFAPLAVLVLACRHTGYLEHQAIKESKEL